MASRWHRRPSPDALAGPAPPPPPPAPRPPPSESLSPSSSATRRPRTAPLRCRDETPSSARVLLARGAFAAEDFLESSPEVERTLMEAYLEDDYEGRLHLTTLSAIAGEPGRREGGGDDDEVVGLAFWREVPRDEMGEWLDMKRIAEAVADGRLRAASEVPPSHGEEEDPSRHAARRMQLVRSDSVGWIESALRPCGDDTPDPSSGTDDRLRTLTHDWIKIELIAIKRTHRARRLGTVLLGHVLARAHASHHNEHAVLHVAGGGASKNVPAARLYGRYGFVPVPRHDEGGPFAKPDKDLFVLGNIGRALAALPWGEDESSVIGGGSNTLLEDRNARAGGCSEDPMDESL
ncbi:hypothetical protein ACHAWF_005590 [Thalassiosira exigua]